MNSKIVGVLVALALLVVGGLTGANVVRLGGATGPSHFQYESFLQGLGVGGRDQFSVSNAGALTTSGAVTVSGTVAVSGAATFTSTLNALTFTQGGGITATSTTANAGTLQAADVDTENVIDFTVNVADVTLTLAASTTAMCPSTAGQVRTFYIRNASTTATADITIAAGTGILLKKATTTAVIYGDTDGANYARIDVTKKANTDCEALLSIFMD